MKGLKAGTHGYAYKHYEYKTRAEALKVIRVRDLSSDKLFSMLADEVQSWVCYQQKGSHPYSRRNYVYVSRSVKFLFRDGWVYLRGLGVDWTVILKWKKSLMNFYVTQMRALLNNYIRQYQQNAQYYNI
jgi:hypothetical protein